MRRTGLFPGSFDPVTNGHLDMFRASFRLVDHLVVAIGINPAKTPVLTTEERRDLILAVAGPLAAASGATIEVSTFQGLVVEEVRRHGATLLLRGLRDGTDLDYEMQMAGMNGRMAPEVQTVFLPASPMERPITATLVRQIAAMGGDIAPFVPSIVAIKLVQKLKKPG